MNKALIIAASLLLPAVAATAQKQDVTITGNVKGVNSGKIYLQKFNNKMFFTVDSAELKKRKVQL